LAPSQSISSFATVFLPCDDVSGLLVSMCTARVWRITYGVACEMTSFASSTAISHAPLRSITGACGRAAAARARERQGEPPPSVGDKETEARAWRARGARAGRVALA
jgi:hypothetical protein